MFQIHLWVGVLLGLYIAAVSVSGSALVFRPEVEPRLVPRSRDCAAPGSTGPFQAAWNNLRQAYPGHAINAISLNQYPGRSAGDPYRVKLQSGSRTFFVYVDCSTGEILGSQHPMIRWLQDLHFKLFAGQRGLIVNGIGALFFVVMCMTGAVIWWPGRRDWKKGFTIAWRSRWLNVNYDLHGVAGIITATPLAAVVVAGGYLTVQYFYGYHPDEVSWQSGVESWSVNLDTVVQRAEAAAPGGVPTFLYFPRSQTDTFRFEKSIAGMPYRISLDQADGHVLRTDNVLDTSVAGWIAKWMGLIHYGRFWGSASRAVWLVLGLVPPLLFLGGFLMWWNRMLVKKLRRLNRSVDAPLSFAGEVTQPPGHLSDRALRSLRPKRKHD